VGAHHSAEARYRPRASRAGCRGGRPRAAQLSSARNAKWILLTVPGGMLLRRSSGSRWSSRSTSTRSSSSVFKTSSVRTDAGNPNVSSAIRLVVSSLPWLPRREPPKVFDAGHLRTCLRGGRSARGTGGETQTRTGDTTIFRHRCRRWDPHAPDAVSAPSDHSGARPLRRDPG
jgi:hypothetical protein